MRDRSTQEAAPRRRPSLSVAKLIRGIAARTSVAESVQDCYDSVVALCCEQLNVEAAALFLENEDDAVLRVTAADGYAKNLVAGSATYSKGEGITGAVWETGRTVKCESYEEMVDHPWREGKYDRLQWTDDKRCHSLLFVALRHEDHIFGVLKAENKLEAREYVRFEKEDVDTLECIAAVISIAVRHALLTERRVKRPNQDEFITSVIRYSTAEVELFLNIDRRHFAGPLIYRDGRSAPRMQIDDWYKQNVDGWAGLPRVVQARHGDQTRFLKALEARGGFSIDPNEWPRGLSLQHHRRQLEEANPRFKILAMQGAGDLTMNLYTLAILDGQIISAPEERRRVRDLMAVDSKTTGNIYRCLVKTVGGMERISIRDVRVDFTCDPPAVIICNSDGSPSGLQLSDIALAVSGRQLVRNRELVLLEKVVHQFTDVRHIFSLPELRGTFFGDAAPQSVYFGEAQFFDDPELRLRALSGPVLLDTTYVPKGTSVPLGANPADVIGQLTKAGYTEVAGRRPARPGEFCRPGPEETSFLVYLRPAYYPLTMVGLDARRETLYLMAVSGQSGRFSLTVSGAARLFRDRFGVADALLVDEGVDVFQQVGELQPVQMNRQQLRAVIAVGGSR